MKNKRYVDEEGNTYCISQPSEGFAELEITNPMGQVIAGVTVPDLTIHALLAQLTELTEEK